ncbi:MAG: dynamin family protein [Candidatus Brocadiae bacterium]|nr:dynamin family protein [Candidatus Brocadiia bacterium]
MSLVIGKQFFQIEVGNFIQEIKQDSKVREILGKEAENFFTRMNLAYGSIDRPFQLLLIGEYSTGKSTFLNSLMGEDIFPVDLTPTDAVISRLCYLKPGESIAEVHFKDKQKRFCDSYQKAWEYLDGTSKDRSYFENVEQILIRHPTPFLQDLEIINTPGINSVFSRDTQIVREYLPFADAVIWMFSAENLSGRCTQNFLQEVAKNHQKIWGIVNMIDIFCEYDDDLEQYGPLDQDRLEKAISYLKENFKLCEEFLPYASKPIWEIKKQLAISGHLSEQHEEEIKKWGYDRLLVSLQQKFFDQESLPRQEKFTKIFQSLKESISILKKSCQILIRQEEKKQQTVFNDKRYEYKINKIENYKTKAKEKLEQEIGTAVNNIFEIVNADQESFIADTIEKGWSRQQQENNFRDNYLSQGAIDNFKCTLEKKAYQTIKKMLMGIKTNFDSCEQTKYDLVGDAKLGRVANIVSNESDDLWSEQIFKRPIKYGASVAGAALLQAVAAGSIAFPPIAIAAGIGALIGGIVSWQKHSSIKTQKIDEAKKRAKTELNKEKRITEMKWKNFYNSLIDQIAENALDALEDQQNESQKQIHESRCKCEELLMIQDHYEKTLESIREAWA